MKENIVVRKRKYINDIGLFIQFLLTALLLIFGIIWLFSKESFVKVIIDLLIGLVFLVMGYNNYKVYKRKAFTALYLIIGIYFLISTAVGIF